MKHWRRIPFVFCLSLSLLLIGRETAGSDDATATAAAQFQAMVEKAVKEARANATAWSEHMKLFEGHDNQQLHAAGGFNCTVFPPSATIPTSVHRLRPGDIKVIAAMGDSITAGFGMLSKTPVTLLTEWRGRVWSIGGDESLESVVTLPNFFRRYNPDLKGFAVGHARMNSVNAPGAHLDVAVSGAKAELMPAQAEKLVVRMKDMPIDFANDWKLVTIFIGANDLCAYNKEKDYYSPEHYLKYLKTALDTLKTIPRTFVNLVEVLEATMVSELDVGPICKTFHRHECPDFMAGKVETIEAGKMVRIQYQKMVETLAGEFSDFDDFTVVHQPFLKDTKPPLHTKGFFEGRPDMSYFAPDCFHFSAKADAAAAEGLWNNMFEAEHEKRTSWRVGEPLVCPTEANPYLKTIKNSNSNSRKRSGSGVDGGEGEGEGDLFEQYPMNTGHAVTWSFVGVLLGIAAVTSLLYYIKTRQARRQDGERSGLLHLDDEDTLFDGRRIRTNTDEFGQIRTVNSNEVAMETIQSHSA